jgi:polysaccharide biosynthesis/export protein
MRLTANSRVKMGLLFAVLSCPLLGQTPSSSLPGDGASTTDGQRTQVQQATRPSSRGNDAGYVIGSDDVLAINVWKEPDLTRSVPVRSDGKISLPLVGEIEAAGRTPLQLEHELAQKLLTYMTDPQVTVIVEQVNSKKFNILGQVTKPGSYSLSVASTVMDAIAAAGGFRDFAKKKGVYVLRQNPDGSQTKIPFNYNDFVKGKNPAQNIKLLQRDTIIVP